MKNEYNFDTNNNQVKIPCGSDPIKTKTNKFPEEYNAWPIPCSDV